jgi:arsenate reductase-like glutaredoxin family protein
MAELQNIVKDMAQTNPFNEAQRMVKEKTGFVGTPIDIDFGHVNIMVNDFHKELVKGVPQSCFLICVKPDNKADYAVEEIILLRVLSPINLPTYSDLLASKVEYVKEFAPSGEANISDKLDPFTKNEFQYSGMRCKILGTYYIEQTDKEEKVCFGADVENFYSSHNYLIYKPTGNLLKFIVNFSSSEGNVGGKDSSRLGILRYSSMRKQEWKEEIPIYIRTKDLLANRTALFGMTRTGKSNTVKKIIDSTVQIAQQEKRKIGQIIFDINGEYANANKQDAGTAIAEKHKDLVSRYSIIDKPGFIPMRANFYKNPEFAFNMIMPFIEDETADYVKNFKAIDLTEPDAKDFSAKIRYNRKVAVLKCCLYRAGFEIDSTYNISFEVAADILADVLTTGNINSIVPKTGISFDQAIRFWETLWENYNGLSSLNKYKRDNDRDWADEDLKTLLRMLTGKKEGNSGGSTVSGWKKIMRPELKGLHTKLATSLFEDDIIKALRDGKIVIVDLSEGAEITRDVYSEKIVTRIFTESMQRFIKNQTEEDGFNVIQLYFEEAHNLFSKEKNKDLSAIYNRLAKEGAKYNLGINYATQEVSSISSNILKNTQNWFVAHLNNTDEIRELTKFYDFKDFEDSILRITDKGFLRIKTYSNDYVIPVQIDKFTAEG